VADPKAIVVSRARVLAAASAAIAAAVGIMVTGQGTPLLARVGAAAFLSIVVFEDVRRMRIPNALTFPALGLSLLAATVSGGAAGFGAALLGALAGLAVLLIPYALGWLGAGDAKAMAVVGALFGAPAVLPLAWWMIVLGGVLAIVVVAARGGLVDLVVRWSLSLAATLAERRLRYFGPATPVAAEGLPFGVAMAYGVVAFSIWGIPWN
jgi:prepilin peptidase CpaA